MAAAVLTGTGTLAPHVKAPGPGGILRGGTYALLACASISAPAAPLTPACALGQNTRGHAMNTCICMRSNGTGMNPCVAIQMKIECDAEQSRVMRAVVQLWSHLGMYGREQACAV